VPLLTGSLAQFECRVASVIEVGDHSIFVGAVEGLQVDEGVDPLIFFAGGYRDVTSPVSPDDTPSFVEC
jgi:flavin reductase (DIM6/NTAB) family NADH-FMN oxidoreductase RutF